MVCFTHNTTVLHDMPILSSTHSCSVRQNERKNNPLPSQLLSNNTCVAMSLYCSLLGWFRSLNYRPDRGRRPDQWELNHTNTKLIKLGEFRFLLEIPWMLYSIISSSHFIDRNQRLRLSCGSLQTLCLSINQIISISKSQSCFYTIHKYTTWGLRQISCVHWQVSRNHISRRSLVIICPWE